MANYRITELDFDGIKENLKDFLRNYRDKENNLIFSDYDFDASSISILLDILAYNTHYNAYLGNMVANEMFLDSAVKRESAVSIAKHLGYVPLSFRSARAILDFTVVPTGAPSSITLPKYSNFTTSIDGLQYTFVNLDSITIKPENNVYRFRDVEVVEGEPLEFTYRVDVSGPDEKYVIPNKNIDTTTIRVTVQNSYTDLTRQSFELAGTLSALSPTSKVFFLEENPSGLFEIFFGDGVLGQKLNPGNLVTVEYLLSNGSTCNVSNKIDQYFTLGTPIGGVNLNSPIRAIRNSTGGDIEDTIEEIKFKAPRFRSSYNRAVTAEDYKSIIEANYPLVESVSVWGGEENDPPLYGKVIISLKPYFGYNITNELKSRIITDILSSRKMIATIPEFRDPNYLHITLETVVRFNPKNSRYTPTQIQTLVRSKIEEYFSLELQKFDRDFVYSKLSKLIDQLDQSIIGNITTFKIHKRITPVINGRNGYAGPTAIKFANTLRAGTISSTSFFYTIREDIRTVYLKDNSQGRLNLLDVFDDSVLIENIGSIDYTNGIISIPILQIAGYLENTEDIRIYSNIDNLDINASKDLILVVDDGTQDANSKRVSGLTVTVNVE